MDGCNYSVKKNHPTLKNGSPKNENELRLKKWMAGHYTSLQIKWHTTLKNRRLQVVFWKKKHCLYKKLMLQIDHLHSSCS